MPLRPFRSLAAAAALAVLTAQAPSAAPVGASLPWCTRIPLPAASRAACRPFVVHAPGGTLRLAVATTEAQRERGLMNVTFVPPSQGMIFAFPDADQVRGFWMKDTVTPLDMVFVRSDGTIDTVAVNVPATPPHTPDDRVALRNGVAHYVIELGAGQAGAMGLLPGSRVVIPPLDAR